MRPRIAPPAALFALVLAGAMACVMTSCSDPGPPATPTPAEPTPTSNAVLVTFYPTRYLTERIAGGRLEVQLPLPEGEDPIFWKPDAETIQAYQSARLVILNGAEFEKWAISAPLPRSRVVDSASDLDADLIEYEHAVTHSHGQAGEHAHTGVDGHTWLDPNNAIRQARVIEKALADEFPDDADKFAINLMHLESDLRYLNERLVAITPDVSRVRLLASHPAYNYIARRHNWAITSLDLDPEAPLDEEDVGKILRAAGEDTTFPIVLLWESEPRAATRAMLQAAGVTSVLFSPAENPSDSELAEHGDYLDIMRANLRRLSDALAGG